MNTIVKKKNTTLLYSVKNWKGKSQINYSIWSVFPSSYCFILLYTARTSRTCLLFSWSFFFLQSITGASPSLAALSVHLMENIWWTATKLHFTCKCSNPTKQECLFFKIENEFPYSIQTRFISMPRFKAEIPRCSLMGNKMKRKS